MLQHVRRQRLQPCGRVQHDAPRRRARQHRRADPNQVVRRCGEVLGRRGLRPVALQPPQRVAVGADQDQPLAGPRHRDVEQPHLLHRRLQLQLPGDQPMRQRRVADPPSAIQPPQAHQQAAVEEHVVLHVVAVELVLQVRQHDDREFQPLGPVDGQDADDVVGFAKGAGRSEILPGRLQFVQEPQEPRQPLTREGVELPRPRRQVEQVRPPLRPAREPRDIIKIPRRTEDVGQQFAERPPPRHRPPRRQPLQQPGQPQTQTRVNRVVGRRRNDGVVERHLAVGQPNPRQLVSRQRPAGHAATVAGGRAVRAGQAHQRAAQQRRERHVLPRVVQHRQQGAEVVDLDGLEVAARRGRVHWHVHRGQLLDDRRRDPRRRTQQDHHIARLRPAPHLGIVVPDRYGR
ncbi:MAG: hypothetical protein BIFFINMI_03751 [Phycisphaerae bacterium]|nr:hypothetical protein [Phycisphaerae bacterium]